MSGWRHNPYTLARKTYGYHRQTAEYNTGSSSVEQGLDNENGVWWSADNQIQGNNKKKWSKCAFSKDSLELTIFLWVQFKERSTKLQGDPPGEQNPAQNALKEDQCCAVRHRGCHCMHVSSHVCLPAAKVLSTLNTNTRVLPLCPSGKSVEASEFKRTDVQKAEEILLPTGQGTCLHFDHLPPCVPLHYIPPHN